MPCQITPQFHQEVDAAIAAYWRKRDIATQKEQEAHLKAKFSGKPLSLSMRLETYQMIYDKNKQPRCKGKLNQAIQLIDQELRTWNGDQIKIKIEDSSDTESPRIRFLLKKRAELIKIKEKLTLNTQQSNDRESTEVISGEKRSYLRIAFDIFKKIADSLDDIWQMIAAALNNPLLRDMVSSFLQGTVGIIIFIAEAYQGIKEAHYAVIANKSILNQRYTRIFTGLLVCALGITGAGLSTAFLASAFGAAISGLPLLPILLPIFLASIYIVKLGKTSYVLDQTRKKEMEDQTNLLHAKHVLERLSMKENPTEEDDRVFFEYQETLLLQQQKYLFARSERLNAERQVAFKAIEVSTTMIVLTGVFMALAVASGIASFGIAPTIIIASGVLLAFSAQIFDYVDERKKNAPTKYIRAGIVNSWSKMTDTMNKAFKPAAAISSASIPPVATCVPLTEMSQTVSSPSLPRLENRKAFRKSK